MAAAAIVGGKNNGLLLFVKPFHQIADQERTHQGMNDWTEYNPVGIDSLQTSQARAYGGKLPVFPLRVQYNERRIEFRNCPDHFSARAQYDTRHANPRMARNLDQMFEKGPFAIGKQCFRSSHPARGACREDNSGKQTGSFN